LKQGEKISNLENASYNLTTYAFDYLQKEIAKTKQVVQTWSKMLNKRKQSMHI
jgi:hypothetical protein